MPDRPTLFLIDGSSYIFRAFYAIRHLSNSKGINRQGGGLTAKALTDKDLEDIRLLEALRKEGA